MKFAVKASSLINCKCRAVLRKLLILCHLSELEGTKVVKLTVVFESSKRPVSDVAHSAATLSSLTLTSETLELLFSSRSIKLATLC